MEKIVVAGGTGLIGSELVANLAGGGREVVVLSRSVAGPILPGGARGVRWDGRSVGAWAAELEGARAVVNLCGAGIADRRWTERRKRLLASSRIGPTRALVEAIGTTKRRPAILLQGSAVGYYGDRGDEPLDEDSEPGREGFLPRLSLDWERASEGVEGLGVRRAVLRTGIVLTRAGGALPVMARPFRLGVGGPIGSGEQWVPWIHRADEVAAIRFLIDAPESGGAYNLAAPEAVTNATLGGELARVLHRPNLLRAPAFALRLVLGEMAEMVLGGQRLTPRRLQEAGFVFRYPALKGALAELYA